MVSAPSQLLQSALGSRLRFEPCLGLASDILRHIMTYYDISDISCHTTCPTCPTCPSGVARRCASELCQGMYVSYWINYCIYCLDSSVFRFRRYTDILYPTYLRCPTCPTSHTHLPTPPPSSYFKTQPTEYALAYDMIILRSYIGPTSFGPTHTGNRHGMDNCLNL